MAHYVICYDIADARRLRKAAKILQGQALRLQKSVYLLVASPTVMQRCWQHVVDCIDPKQDDLRCYTIPAHSPLQSWGANVLHDGVMWSGFLEN